MTWHRLRTERLIERLVADLRPWQIERRIRTHRLSMAAVLAIVLPPLALAQPFRADLASRLADAMFVASIATSAMIFVTGLVTVLILGTPGRSCSGFWFRWLLAGYGSSRSQQALPSTSSVRVGVPGPSRPARNAR
ncbi:NrsF family protein [Afipia sp. P52-10]|uniref:NrsF family protein n=1 Tax=Afipia sp. P52-10 TaxID=1429916 RepID=UPI001267F058